MKRYVATFREVRLFGAVVWADSEKQALILLAMGEYEEMKNSESVEESNLEALIQEDK